MCWLVGWFAGLCQLISGYLEEFKIRNYPNSCIWKTKLSLLSSRHFYKGKTGKIVECVHKEECDTTHPCPPNSTPSFPSKVPRQQDFKFILSRMNSELPSKKEVLVHQAAVVQISWVPSSCSSLSKARSTPTGSSSQGYYVKSMDIISLLFNF